MNNSPKLFSLENCCFKQLGHSDYKIKEVGKKNLKGNWQKTRKLFNDLHLWFGLTGGILIFLICLSGTIYTFSSEIQEFLEPDLYTFQPPINQARIMPEKLITIVEHESNSKAVSILIPEKSNHLYRIAVENPEGKGRPLTYNINPYTGEIKGIAGEGKGSAFFFTMFKLHRWLLMETTTGRPIVGIATILFAFGCLTGMVIWFPQKIKYWRQGLKIKLNGNWKRTNHDLHNSLGIYAVLFLLIMALTGLCWSFVWYKEGLSKVLGAKVFSGRDQKELIIETPENLNILPLNEILKIGKAHFGRNGNLKLNFPKNENNPIVLLLNKNGFFASAGTDKIQLNSFTGDVIQQDFFSDKPFNQKVAESIKPLHTGEILGTFSKIIYFLSCFIATSLPVTGTIIWWNKLKKKQNKKKKDQKKQRSLTAAQVSE